MFPAPDNWYTAYPQCAGKEQSPVDVINAHVQYNKALEQSPIEFFGPQDANESFQLQNNGHSGNT